MGTAGSGGPGQEGVGMEISDVAQRSGWRLALAGYAVTALAFRREPRRLERSVFTRINEASDSRWLRAPQQLGTPWVLPGLAVVQLLAGRPRDAVLAAACLPVVKGAEVATKKLVRRPRPVYTGPTELRDDAPVEGPSFPSGHTAIATCLTVLVARTAPHQVGVALGAGTALSAYVRVHQGAHHPSDTLGGLLLGCLVAGLLDDIVPGRAVPAWAARPG